MAVAPLPAAATESPTRVDPSTPSIESASRFSTRSPRSAAGSVSCGVTISWLFTRRPRWSVLVPNFYAIGVQSVPGRGHHRDVHRHGPGRPGL